MNQENVDIFSAENTKNPLYLHVAKTYGWMFIGLFITFATALAFCHTGAILLMVTVPALPFILAIALIVLVVVVSVKIKKLKVSTAKILFVAYSFFIGITLTPILIQYGVGSALTAFGITAVFFGILAGAGLVTKKDLSKFGPMILIALIVLVVVTFISIFIRADILDMMISYIGVLIFFGVTAYDSNKIRSFYYTYQDQPEMLERASIYSALSLYLDFINLFIYIFRLGKRK